MVDREFGAAPSVAFRRVVYRAVARVKSLDRKTTGADVLAAMFDQTEKPRSMAAERAWNNSGKVF